MATAHFVRPRRKQKKRGVEGVRAALSVVSGRGQIPLPPECIRGVRALLACGGRQHAVPNDYRLLTKVAIFSSISLVEAHVFFTNPSAVAGLCENS